jgi:molybdate transport system substrate-binding protein
MPAPSHIERLVQMRFVLVLCLLLGPVAAHAQQLTVFAAASLTDAMKDVSAAWVKAGHPPLTLSFGASSTLARQIEQGAPANLFASADENWMDYLVKKNLIADGTRKSLLGNDLVLIVPANKPQTITISPTFDIAKLLGTDGRLATGDPAHVPVGIYAEQALRKLGWWDTVSPRLARTDDVRAALLLVERGEAPAGIVYGTDAAVSKGVMIAGVFPENSHDAVSYPFAVTRSGDTPDARVLLDFLAGPQARALFVQRGFRVE